ncbi:MAG: hypothetical protein WA926_00035 [Methylovirgula sp.]
MRVIAAIAILFAIVILVARAGSTQFRLTMGETVVAAPLLRATCLKDEDAQARVHAELIRYVRHRGISEQEFGRHIGSSTSALEQFACAAEVSGTTVPAALQALGDFKAFLTDRGYRGAAQRLALWGALCHGNACEATVRKLRNELRSEADVAFATAPYSPAASDNPHGTQPK